ncbi:MAG: hypothetical protein RL562_2420, partial [Planctomycetota bacterium]
GSRESCPRWRHRPLPDDRTRPRPQRSRRRGVQRHPLDVRNALTPDLAASNRLPRHDCRAPSNWPGRGPLVVASAHARQASRDLSAGFATRSCTPRVSGSGLRRTRRPRNFLWRATPYEPSGGRCAACAVLGRAVAPCDRLARSAHADGMGPSERMRRTARASPGRLGSPPRTQRRKQGYSALSPPALVGVAVVVDRGHPRPPSHFLDRASPLEALSLFTATPTF